MDWEVMGVCWYKSFSLQLIIKHSPESRREGDTFEENGLIQA